MNEEIRELLDEEIQSQIEAMSSLEAGSKEQTAAAENVAKLIRLGIDEDKNAKEAMQREDAMYSEEKYHAAQLKEQKVAKWVQIGGMVAVTVAELLFYGYWIGRGYKFEEEGVVSSPTLKSVIQKFRPSKR